jgi:hypothetical protein
MSSALALQESPPVQYGAKPFTSERAREAGRRGNETMAQYRMLAKSHEFVTEPKARAVSIRTAVADCRRALRRLLRQACVTCDSTEALNFVRAASMVFEMECTLTGRKLTKGQAGKPPGKLKPTDELPLPMELPPSDMPPLDESTLPPKLTSEPIEPASES